MLQTAVVHAFMQEYNLKGVLYSTPAGEFYEMFFIPESPKPFLVHRPALKVPSLPS